MFKFFNGKKKDDFFLELKEEAQNITENITEKAQNITENIKEEAQNIISNITEDDSAEPAEKQKHVEAETATEEKKAKPVAASKTQKAPAKTSKTTKVEPKPAPAPVEETPAWVKALYKTNSQKEKEDPTFATKYLIDSSMSRRRPGPSLTGFRGMARQMKRG